MKQLQEFLEKTFSETKFEFVETKTRVEVKANGLSRSDLKTHKLPILNDTKYFMSNMGQRSDDWYKFFFEKANDIQIEFINKYSKEFLNIHMYEDHIKCSIPSGVDGEFSSDTIGHHQQKLDGFKITGFKTSMYVTGDIHDIEIIGDLVLFIKKSAVV